MKVAYLGPAGTFSEEALRLAAAGAVHEPVPMATIHAAVAAVESGAVERALVPFENSIEGTVRPTLDALAFDTERVRIVGEFDHRVHQALIAARSMDPAAVELVLSHPQPIAQCARFLRIALPAAAVETVSSTAEAVRRVLAEPDRPWAALGSASAADTYGGVVLREDVEDAADNVTRFAWLADASAEAPPEEPDRAWRTTLVFDELGDDRPGALVEALAVLSDRGINMTRIESRPRRSGLGAYLFFVDLDGRADRGLVAEGIAALGERAETVRVLGSYQVGAVSPLPR
ncbi:MAG TPA: prephenate dehydratase [Solirubrobacterales bacterium]|nr:prephenate dehydratase [Solirubrobacterales bacterium]